MFYTLKQLARKFNYSISWIRLAVDRYDIKRYKLKTTKQIVYDVPGYKLKQIEEFAKLRSKNVKNSNRKPNKNG